MSKATGATTTTCDSSTDDDLCADWFLSQDEQVQPLPYVFENQHLVLWSTPHHMRQTLYGAYLRVWPSAVVLAKFLVDRLSSLPAVVFHHLLEVGAGVGFCSIATCLVTGYNIVATDGDTDVLTYLERNCQQTRGLVHPEKLQWGDNLAIQALRQKYAISGFPYVFGADVVYHKESIPLLVSTVAQCSVKRQGWVFLACSRQFQQLENDLLKCMETYAFCLKETTCCDSVVIFTFQGQ